MNYNSGMRLIAITLISLILQSQAQAIDLRSSFTTRDHSEIEDIILAIQPLTFSDRMEFASRAFLSLPYVGGPLGEGPTGEYDQDPLYRTDSFDCTTLVETVTAIAESQSLDQFKVTLNRIRYKNAVVKYTERNHFVEIDWNPNNQAWGLIEDITLNLGSKLDHYVVPQLFNKKIWYESKSADDLKVIGLSPEDRAVRLEQFRKEGNQYKEQLTTLPILAKSSLRRLLPQIPAPAVLNIVRALGPLPGMPETFVTHQILLVRHEGELRIRQATSRSQLMKVIDLSIDEFLQTPIMLSPDTRGLNIQKINSTF